MNVLDTILLLFIQLVRKDIMAVTVPKFVLLLVKHVDTQTDCVHVKQDGGDIIVQQVMFTAPKTKSNR